MRVPDGAAGPRKPPSEGICTALSDLPDTALITPKALADALGKSESSVRRAVSRGELPPQSGSSGDPAGRSGLMFAASRNAWKMLRARSSERGEIERNVDMEAMTVSKACELAAISRSSFYRLLDDPDAGLAEIAVRIPGMRCIRVPRQAFIQWLQSRPLKPRRRT